MARRTGFAIAATGVALALAAPARAELPGDMLDNYARALGLAEEAEGEVLALAAAPVGSEELAGMRGGFALPGGMVVNFGFAIETRLAGQVVQRLVMPVSQIGSAAAAIEVFDAGAAYIVAPGGGPVVVDRSFNGGATRIMTAIDGGITGIVQNSRDGQVVQRRAEFQVDIAGMRRMLDAGAARRTLQGAFTGGPRRPL
jgi:hypothetical protein